MRVGRVERGGGRASQRLTPRQERAEAEPGKGSAGLEIGGVWSGDAEAEAASSWLSCEQRGQESALLAIMALAMAISRCENVTSAGGVTWLR